MNYKASITDFFKTPRWQSNMWLGSVCLLIPMVGPIVLGGWHITCLWARGNHKDPASYPALDFQYFGKYLERGLWPFLVGLVASLVLIPILLLLAIPLIAVIALHSPATQGNESNGAWIVVVVMAVTLLQGLTHLFFQAACTPLTLRATLLQDFKSAFDVRFIKSFLVRTWKESLISVLVMLGIGICVMILTVITCYIGGLLAGPIAIFAWHHLQQQLYQLHLTRGGEALSAHAKLNDLPPPLPVE